MTTPEQPPVWDGEGTDPWLPQRLAAVTAVVVGERTIWDDYFARLSAWLVQAARRVTSGPTVDPNSIWALSPRWVSSMTEFVNTAIRAMVGASYRRLLGDGYQFDQRPFVANYLTQARNRLIDVPEQVYTRVVGQIAEGSAMGESIADIRDRVQQVFDVTDTPYWRNRATVVARTETLGAYNSGRQDSFVAVAEELDEPFEKMWLATVDNRTRPAHRAADLQRVPLGAPFIVGGFPMMRPGDPTAPADLVIQCRCTTLLVRPGEDLDLSNRQMVDFR